jgi:hypothetical protein
MRPVLQDGPAHAARAAGAAVRHASPWLERGARLGYAASGLVYVTLGILALQAATIGGKIADSRGAITTLGQQPAGKVLLLLIGVGLLAYAVWRLLEAATGAEGEGSDAKGMAKRAAHALSGLLFGSLGLWTLRLLAGSRQGGGGGAEGWTARLMALPLGRGLVAAVGLGVLAYALMQLLKAATRRTPDYVHRHLDLHEVGPEGDRWIVRLARMGFAARGIVFAVTGAFLVNAALRYDPGQAAGLDEALAALARVPAGSVVLALVALGLVAFGGWQFVNARYRTVATPA